ncbi:STAS domain-containing protein [Streptomyces albus]|uniref:STAS domain-containing protein n=1 Tax=Streptomyces albus TaxID=1888 RepID=UPI0036FB345C
MTDPAPRAQPLGRWTATGTARQESFDRAAAQWPCLATLTMTARGSRVRVRVRGELDLAGRRLLPELHHALRRSDSGIDLDLAGLAFCDCAGLSVLLEVRRRALAQGKTVTIVSSSPQVQRLLDLTGVRECLYA